MVETYEILKTFIKMINTKNLKKFKKLLLKDIYIFIISKISFKKFLKYLKN